MKTIGKILTSVLTAVMLISLLTVNVKAAEQPYTYTVTFYAGNQGSFEKDAEMSLHGLSVSNPEAQIRQEEDKIVISGLHAGDEVGLTAQAAVELDTTSKYYVKGIRLSGRDNDTVAASGFSVKGDVDYVVAYGIKGNQVSYTVHYQDAQGKTLSSSETFYGNVGDKPVVAYKFIDGYAPKVLGITKTLSANAAENVFTFVYDNMPTPDINQIVTEEVITNVETIVVGGVTVVVPNGNGTDADENTEEGTGTGTEPGSEDDSEGSSADDGNETPGPDNEGGSAAQDREDSEILDLDDEEVPLADQETDGSSQGAEVDRNMVTYIGLAVAAIAVLVILFVVLIIMKKRNVKEQEEE